MALPSIEQVSQTINGVTVPCAHITCTEAANFRMENVLDTINSGSFTFQSVMRSNANRNIVIAVGNKEATYELTSAWAKFVTLYEDVDPQTGGRDMNIFFPAGEYWLYHTMLEHGNKVSDWKVSPEDTEEQIAQVYVEIREQYTQIMSDTERILLEALSSYTKVSDFETFKTENTAAIELKADEITSTVAATYQTKDDASTMQTQISQNATALAGKVNVNEYTAAQIALMINNAGEGEAIISAPHIQLDGNVVLKGDLTTAGGVAINGENISAGTIGANQIAAHSVTVDRLTGTIKDDADTPSWTIDLASGTMTIGNISANNISGGTMSADRISGGTIDGQNVTINNLNASNITAGTLSVNRIPNLSADKITTGTMSADRISGGSIDASDVTITNLSADNIKAGTISAAIEATNFTMKGGRINIATDNESFDFIHLGAKNGSDYAETDMYPLGLDLRSKSGSYVTNAEYHAGGITLRYSDGTSILSAASLVFKDSDGNDSVRVTGSTGEGKFKSLFIGDINVATAVNSAYSIGSSAYNSASAARLKEFYGEVKFSGTNITNGSATWFTQNGLCFLTFYFQSGAKTDAQNITITGLPKNVSNNSVYCALSGVSGTPSNLPIGRAMISGDSNKLNITTHGAGALYGFLVYAIS